jgi:hypothetical protein
LRKTPTCCAKRKYQRLKLRKFSNLLGQERNSRVPEALNQVFALALADYILAGTEKH